MKKTLKWLFIVLLTPVVLFVVLAALLYVPAVQNWVVQRVVAVASEQTGMQISVEHIDLDFPLDLGIDGILVVDRGDTVAHVRRAVADVELWPLLSSRVVVKQLLLEDACLNTHDMIGDARIDGCIGRLELSSPGIDLNQQTVELVRPRLTDSNLRIWLSDTAAVDTTVSESWRIKFDSFVVKHTCLALYVDSAAMFATPATALEAYLGQATIGRSDLNLTSSRFGVNRLTLSEGRLRFNDLLDLREVSLGLDTMLYAPGNIHVGIKNASMADVKWGITLSELHGSLLLDDDRLSIRSLELSTPSSRLQTNATVDGMSRMDSTSHVSALLAASIGKADLRLLSPALDLLPDYPLLAHVRAEGSMADIRLEEMRLSLPQVFRLEGSGKGSSLTDDDRRTATVELTAETFDLQPLLLAAQQHSGQPLLPAGFALPSSLALDATLTAHGQRYAVDAKLRQDGGTARLTGSYDAGTASYEAQASMERMNIKNFMPADSIYLVSADVSLTGHGADFLSPRTQMEAFGIIHKLRYGQWDLDSIALEASLNQSRLTATLNSQNALLGGRVALEASLARQGITADVTTTLSHIDFHGLGVTDRQLNIPLDAVITLLARDDTTSLHVSSGDLTIRLDTRHGYEQLLATAMQIADTLKQQLYDRTIDQLAVKQLLPSMTLYMDSHQDNTLARVLKQGAGIGSDRLLVDLVISPETGINGQAKLYGLDYDGTRIDTLRLTLVERTKGLTFNGQVTRRRPTARELQQNPNRQTESFNVLFDGFLQEHGASFGLRYFDGRGLLAVRLGAKAEMEGDGLRFHLIPARPTLGYKEFALNSDNFLFLHNNLKIEADVDLRADDGTRLTVYSAHQDSTLLQDLTLSTHRLDLGALTSSISFLPKVDGLLEGDCHLAMDTARNISLSGDIFVEQMGYEGSHIGNLGTQLVYMNREDGSHLVEAELMLDDESVGTLQGNMLANGLLEGTLLLSRMPLTIVNGFIPDQIIGLEGQADGNLTVKGQLADMKVNGQLALSNGYLVSTPYGMSMRFQDEPVNIVDSKLLLEEFKLYAYNDNPLTVNGSINLLNTGQGGLDLRMSARNFLLVNARQKKESVAYGKMFVNFFARLDTAGDIMKMRGRLDVLGSTDLNYILLDSPLSTDNQMDELVHFTDFSDTTAVVVKRPTPDGFDMDLTISIDQGAHVRCALNADQTNYVDLMGGGDMRMRMGTDGLNLTGRYTIQSGTMKYSMPVIPLKTFTIQNGSYVEFTGQADNPRLNLTATERQRAAVSQEDGQTRSVLFDCGVVITRTLNDMGLAFTISAPEDIQMQSEVASMSSEQRGKLAVTMLTTGMYLADGNTSAFSMNSALSSFLQNEINNITAGALKTLDLKVGVDNTTDAAGQSHMDYSFSFAKRFWNNRLSVQIGGKVSTGTEIEGQNQSFFDNVTMEYRLSPSDNQYVKLFYKQNVYDWLDGYTGEYGGGYIWKRKMDRLTDIFKATPKPVMRPRPANPQVQQKPDSIQPVAHD